MVDLSSEIELQLSVIRGILTAARGHLNESSVLQACAMMQTLSVSLEDNKIQLDCLKETKELNLPGFLREVLSDNVISSNIELVYIQYFTLHHLLGLSLFEGQLYSTDFITFLTTCVVRDIAVSFNLAEVIMPCMCAYISGMKEREMILVLRDVGFHSTVTNLLQICIKSSSICKAMRLLSCLVIKYDDHLKDVKSFVDVGVPQVVVEKVKLAEHDDDFIKSFEMVMLSITAKEDAALELYRTGVLKESLLPLVGNENMVNLWDIVIDSIGNILLAGHQVTQLLLDCQFHITLVFVLGQSRTLLELQSCLVPACMRILSRLSSDYPVKKDLLEHGLIETLLSIMQILDPEGCPMLTITGFLQSVIESFDPQFVYTSALLDTLLSILSCCNDSEVIYWITDIIESISQLNPGAKRLRKSGAAEVLQEALNDPVHCETYPHLKHLKSAIFESLNLYTLSSQSVNVVSYQSIHPCDWPLIVKSKEEKEAPCSLSLPSCVLPTGDSCFIACIPTAPSAAESLVTALGLDPTKPLFRVGRFYGNDVWPCKACGEGVTENLVFQPLSMTCEQYQGLVDNGWHRRGGVRMYRLRHTHQFQCTYWETRVIVKNFDPGSHKSYKKVLRRMPISRLVVETRRSHFNRQAFDLYNAFHKDRFDVDADSEHYYWRHVVNTPIPYEVIDGVECGTFHQMYWLDRKLVAVEVFDIIPKGIVSVYMWYDISRDVSKYSFGVYSILKGIDKVKSLSEKHPNMAYYYLQGWNPNHKGLGYKSDYQPEEFYCPCAVEDWVLGLDEVNKSGKGDLKCSNKDYRLPQGSSSVIPGVDSGTEPAQNDSDGSITDSFPSNKEPFQENGPNNSTHPTNNSTHPTNKSVHSNEEQFTDKRTDSSAFPINESLPNDKESLPNNKEPWMENELDSAAYPVEESLLDSKELLRENETDTFTCAVNESKKNESKSSTNLVNEAFLSIKEQVENTPNLSTHVVTKVFSDNKEQCKGNEPNGSTQLANEPCSNGTEQVKENEIHTSVCPAIESLSNSQEQFEEGGSDSSPHFNGDSLSIDVKRNEKLGGERVDISKTVVCLNHVDFIHLEDLFKLHVTDDKQKCLIKSRITELYLSLPLELRSQLVIDMAAC